MTSKQDTSDPIQLVRDGAMFPPGTKLVGIEGIERIASFLEGITHPDFVTVMVARSVEPNEFRGIEGYKEALSDWITPYAEFRLEIDEVISRDDRIIFLVRQIASTKHGGVEVENPSAADWILEEGKVRQATFYLDQRTALEAAGVDPDAPR